MAASPEHFGQVTNPQQRRAVCLRSIWRAAITGRGQAGGARAVRHDDAADEARGRAPAGLLHVHQLARLVQEARAKRLCKVVAQLVAGARLRPGQPLATRLGWCSVVLGSVQVTHSAFMTPEELNVTKVRTACVRSSLLMHAAMMCKGLARLSPSSQHVQQAGCLHACPCVTCRARRSPIMASIVSVLFAPAKDSSRDLRPISPTHAHLVS